jgi:hypothetical protein
MGLIKATLLPVQYWVIPILRTKYANLYANLVQIRIVTKEMIYKLSGVWGKFPTWIQKIFEEQI